MPFGIEANFSVWVGSRLAQEFPYRDHCAFDAQRELALALYARLAKSSAQNVTLTRLAIMDLCEGDYAPTLLRDSSKPEYIYDGFSGI
jgi:hypothetical protein